MGVEEEFLLACPDTGAAAPAAPRSSRGWATPTTRVPPAPAPGPSSCRPWSNRRPASAPG